MAKRRQRGKRGRGSVYFDEANRTWMAAVSLRTSDGKRIRRKARALDEDDAEVQLQRLLRATQEGIDPAKGTLDRYMHAWLADVKPSIRPSTWRSYEGHVRLHISPLLGGIGLVRLRPSDVRRLKASLLTEPRVMTTVSGAKVVKPPRSAATVGRILTTLRIALNQAVRDRLLPDNPADAVPLPRVELEPIAPLTEADAEAIIAACRGSSVEHLVVLLLGSGMRLGEALGLDWRDVDLEAGYVVVRHSKTRVRAVPVSDDAVESLRVQKGATPRYGPTEPVFISQKRSRLTRQRERMRADSALGIFQKRLEDARLPRMRLHDLRHGVATLLVARGVHMRVIAEQLGHRNPSMTNRYAHVVPASQREAVDLLNRPKKTG